MFVIFRSYTENRLRILEVWSSQEG